MWPGLKCESAGGRGLSGGAGQEGDGEVPGHGVGGRRLEGAEHGRPRAGQPGYRLSDKEVVGTTATNEELKMELPANSD